MKRVSLPATFVTLLALLGGCHSLQPAVQPDGLPAVEPRSPVSPPEAAAAGAPQVAVPAGGAALPDAAAGPEGTVADSSPGAPDQPAADGPPPLGPPVWGRMGLRGYPLGTAVAPNGLAFKPLFSLDLDVNVWLWRDEKLYLFSDTRFWAQKAAPGITNANQGAFDFSKREFDLDVGLAWNYCGPFEARAFAYSFNNLNRGFSPAQPSGYNDGVGLENRWYVGGTYAELGRPGFDVARASFLSLGFYPTKDMTDGDGNLFKPGPFARAYLVWELFGERCYLYADGEVIGKQSFTPKLVNVDGGAAVRPFRRLPYVEFRVGSENKYDIELGELMSSLYGSVWFVW